jgi:hypothetical protein
VENNIFARRFLPQPRRSHVAVSGATDPPKRQWLAGEVRRQGSPALVHQVQSTGINEQLLIVVDQFELFASRSGH